MAVAIRQMLLARFHQIGEKRRQNSCYIRSRVCSFRGHCYRKHCHIFCWRSPHAEGSLAPVCPPINPFIVASPNSLNPFAPISSSHRNTATLYSFHCSSTISALAHHSASQSPTNNRKKRSTHIHPHTPLPPQPRQTLLRDRSGMPRHALSSLLLRYFLNLSKASNTQCHERRMLT